MRIGFAEAGVRQRGEAGGLEVVSRPTGVKVRSRQVIALKLDARIVNAVRRTNDDVEPLGEGPEIETLAFS